MKLRRMRDLSRDLGIPIRTFQLWVEQDPDLAVYIPGGRGGGSYWIKLDKLVGRQGIGPADVYMLGTSRWLKAVTLATKANIPRKTIANWCRSQPGFAKRIGRIYYIDLAAMGATEEQVISLLSRRSGPDASSKGCEPETSGGAAEAASGAGRGD